MFKSAQPGISITTVFLMLASVMDSLPLNRESAHRVRDSKVSAKGLSTHRRHHIFFFSPTESFPGGIIMKAIQIFMNIFDKQAH